MDGSGRERRDADGDVLAAFGRGVANPLAFARDQRLAGSGFHDAAFVFQAHLAAQHQRELVEVGTLARFGPTCGAGHAGDAGLGFAVVHGTNVFADNLVPGDRDLVGLGDQLGHRLSIGSGQSDLRSRVVRVEKWSRTRCERFSLSLFCWRGR